jgi:O-acetylhomoserine/O-acetylserine sulfhydrylase-like pyridoxal-dependent enzyme
MPDRLFRPETLAIHAGQVPDAETGARALPIYQTTSFVFDSADHAASLFNLQTFGNVYSRLSNPTVAALEQRVAALEGGRAAVACASGMAAEATALMTILQAGDHVVAAGALYGGSVTMLAVNLRKFGVETSFVDATDPDAFAAAIRPSTRALYVESLGNPSLVVADIARLADVAHAHGLPLVVDNTVPSPFLCNPIALGADIVVHSATKYLGGHGTTLAGVVVESGKFPWDNGKFPGHDRALARLPRRALVRDLRRLRLHDALPDGDAAGLRRVAVADERLADPAGRRDAAAAHGAALRQRAGRGAIPGGRPARGLRQLPRACRTTRSTRWSGARCAAPRACSPSA